jgi:hypothetical protein
MKLSLDPHIFQFFAGQFLVDYHFVVPWYQILVVDVERFIFSEFKARLLMKRLKGFDCILIHDHFETIRK